MKCWLPLCISLFALSACSSEDGGAASGKSGDPEERAKQLLDEVPIIDGHNDVPWAYKERVNDHLDQIDFMDTQSLEKPMHTDLPRLRQGRVGAQFWSVFIPVSEAGPGAAEAVLQQIDFVHRLVDRYSDDLEMAYTVDDILRIQEKGKIASLIGMEGGHSIENSLAVLRQLYRCGARYMTITHSRNTDWADACTDDPEFDGLSPFGEEVIREMNRMGMIVDLSHVSADTMRDALDIVEAPVIFSHSSAFAKADTPRNVPDDVLRRIPANDGVVMVTFVPSFLSQQVREYGGQRRAERDRLREAYPDDEERVSAEMEAWDERHPRPKANLTDVADHIDHIHSLIGVDHIGIGSDFDGVGSLPVGLEDCSTYPALMAELLRRGYSDEDIKKIAGLNLLRVMRKVEETAAKLSDKEPSDVLFEELHPSETSEQG